MDKCWSCYNQFDSAVTVAIFGFAVKSEYPRNISRMQQSNNDLYTARVDPNLA